MRYLFTGVFFLSIVFSLQAQDGIYGSFNVGQKIMAMEPLNDKLKEMYPSYQFDDFINNYWTFGGEGHIILAKHLVLGGKGYALGLERELQDADTSLTVKVVGGLGVMTLGYAFLAGKESQLRLIPQVGLGLSTFLLQNKMAYEGSEDDFDSAFVDDKRSVLTRFSFVTDVGLVLDWYIKLIRLVKIIPGLEFGPLIHADIGYTFVPASSEWVRDFNDAGSGDEPDLNLKGFYVNVGLGFGLSSSKQ